MQDSFRSNNVSGRRTFLSVPSHSQPASQPRSVQRKVFASHSMTECKNRQICSKKPTQWSLRERCVIRYYWYHFSPVQNSGIFCTNKKNKTKLQTDTWIQNLLRWCYIVWSTILITFLICPSSFLWSQPLIELSSVVPVPLYPPAHSSCTFHRSENWKHRIVCSNPLPLTPTVQRPTLVGQMPNKNT